MSKQLVLFALIAFATNGFVGAQVIGWRNCAANSQADVEQIVVTQTGGPGSTNCVTQPCSFVRGNTYNIEVTAVSLASTTTMNFQMTAVILGIEVLLTSGNACDGLVTGICPVVPGNRFVFRYVYTVPTTFPTVPAVVTSRVQNDQGVEAICIAIDTVIA